MREITPNLFNSILFEDSLRPESIAELARDIKENGLHYPIRVTKVGSVIIDGERRYRACKLLGWDEIDVVEEDLHKYELLDHIIDAVSSQRHMTLFEQARVYRAYYNHLRKGKRKGNMRPIDAKKLAMQRAHFAFTSWTMADQLVQVLDRGDADLHQKLLQGDISISAAYERLERRPYNRLPKLAAPPEPPSPEVRQAREAERKQRQVEAERTRNYVEAKREKLQSAEAQQELMALFEPDPPPPAQKFRENAETRVIAEAFESLAVREEPEKLVGRLTGFIENIIAGVKQLDEQRARDIVREVVKPMVLRLAHEFPRREFDTPKG